MKKCPFCAEDIQDEAIKCKHCSEFLTARPEVPKTPWYAKTPTLILSFLTIGPFALPLVWLNPAFSRRKKIIVTVIVVAITYFLAAAVIKSATTIITLYKQGLF